ncbi:MAG: ankyrin repeat domain-containing protein [Alphaproteobacteria bacterium]
MNKIIIAVLMIFLASTATLAQTAEPAPLDTSKIVSPQKEIIYRVHLGRAADVKLLIDNGVSPNLTNDEGIPILALAAMRKDPEGINILQTLLDSGADVNGRDTQGQTALFHAARAGQKESVMFLLQHGVNYYQVDNNGDIARNIAHQEGHAELLASMDDFVKQEAEKIKQQYVEYNESLQERYEAERKIIEAYDQRRLDIEQAQVAAEVEAYNAALAEQQAQEAEYQRAIENIRIIEQKKRELIIEKRSLPAFSESLRELSFHTCAFQYWSFCRDLNQTTEIPKEKIGETIDEHYAKILALSDQISAEYELEHDYTDKIIERSKRRAYNPLARMPSKTYRFQNGVGKIADMKTRCNEVAKNWNVENVHHLDTPPSKKGGKAGKHSKDRGVMGFGNN